MAIYPDASGRASPAVHIALLVGNANAYDRDLLAGIRTFARRRLHWRLHPFGHRVSEPGDVRGPLQRWRGEAIIASVGDRRDVETILARGLPTVFVGHFVTEGLPALTRVRTDVDAGADLAAGHLLDAGLTHLGFVGLEGVHGSMRRGGAFAQAVEAAGRGPVARCDLPTRADVEKKITMLTYWLSDLPRPAGVLALDDTQANLVLTAAADAGLDVPGDIAVLGVGNDEALCESVHPALSSLDVNLDEAGFRAAELLDSMLHGKAADGRTVVVPPVGVIERDSTRVNHFTDPVVAAALDFIRQSADEGINVADVVEASDLQRSALERRFLTATGRTLGEDLRRVRLEMAKTMLRETDLTVAEIADRCGFGYASGFTRTFLARVGQTPRAFRERYRR